MFAIGNDELEKNGLVEEYEKCRVCGELHKVHYGETVNKDGSKTPSKDIACITCPKTMNTYLVGLFGKKITP